MLLHIKIKTNIDHNIHLHWHDVIKCAQPSKLEDAD